MKIIEKQIYFSAESLTLTNQRVIFWERQKAIILSDLHLGKAAHFRKNGIALPTQISLQDLQRLGNLILHFKAEKIIVVGDLVHADANKEVAMFNTFTLSFPDTKFILIRGNHDRFSERKWLEMGVSEVHQILQIDTICFMHHHRSSFQGFSISGHVHCGVNVELPTQKKLKFPCYVVAAQQIILPAFSQFTGLNTSPFPGKSVCYAFYEDGIFKV